MEGIASAIAGQMGMEAEIIDFTLPTAREKPLKFGAEELGIFGTPVIAGRVSNVLLKYLDTIEGNGAAAVPAVLYSNRDYDDALIELRNILENHGLHTVAAAAFISEHSFSYDLAKGRPDETDMELAKAFAGKVTEKIKGLVGGIALQPIDVKGIHRFPVPTGAITSPGTARETPSISGK